jgi:outer membrane receptor protein involved in Fe transport
MGYQNTNLNGEFVLTQTPVNYSFQNFLPAVRANYDFTQFKHLRFNYQTGMTTPSFTQLNPVPDNSNQANISIGNPDLAPSYTHSGTVNYTAFNPNKFINFFSTVSANYGLNSIVNSQTTTTALDANGNRVTTRSTQPVNVKNSTNLNANFNFGFPITKLKSRFNVGPNARYSKSLSVNNTNNYGVVTAIEGSTEQQTYGGRAGYNLTFGTIYSLDLSANLNYSQTKYEVSPNQNQKFFNKVFQAQSNLKFLKSYTFNGTFTYTMSNTISTGYKLNVPILNLSVSRLVFKNQAGEVKLGVNNALNKSQSVQQTVDVNTGSLTTTRYNNLGRYFMVSFTYALNKNLNPAAGRGGQGGVRIERFD